MNFIWPALKRLPAGLPVFTVTYLVLSVVAALQSGNHEFIFYIGILVALMVVVLALHNRIGLSRGVLWGLSVWGLAHMAGGLVVVPESWPINGEIRVLYSWWLIPGRIKFDHVVHAFGFGVTTFLCWEGLCAIFTGGNSGNPVVPTFGALLLCGAAAMGFGALNEVVEFAATLLVPETNVGGYINTGWDLVANLVGISIAAVLICVRSSTPDSDESEGLR